MAPGAPARRTPGGEQPAPYRAVAEEVVAVATNNPLTKRELDRIRAMHGEGKSRNDIAKALGRSASTITAACNKMGLSFDRTKTKAATEAKVADAKARRAEIALGLLDDVQRLREQLFAEAVIYSFGGKDNTYAQRKVPEPPPRDKRDLMGSISLALNASLRLDDHDGDKEGLAAVDAWLKAMLGE